MNPGKPLKRTELKRKTPLTARTPMPRGSSLHRSGSINPVSAKRRRERPIYAKRAAAFKVAHPVCQFPAGCERPSQEVHHRKGRTGVLYLDESHWSALCHKHHVWATEHPQAAYEIGISERRNVA